MNPPDGHEGGGVTAPRAPVIDRDELGWALNSRDPVGQGSHWLNLESGELLFLAESGTLDEATEQPRDDEDWLHVEAVESSEVIGIMGDFVDRCDDLRRSEHPAQREAWFVFERLRSHPPPCAPADFVDRFVP